IPSLPPARSATCTSSTAWPPTCRSSRAWHAHRPQRSASAAAWPRPRRTNRRTTLPAPVPTDDGPTRPTEPPMFAYYFKLALRSFRRNRVLTALMVLAIALGIGACMTTLTTFHVLSGDPIPAKSDRLYYVQLDPAGMRGYNPGEEPADQSTRLDAEALLREKRGDRQAMMTGGVLAVSPEREGTVQFITGARYTSTDLFPMFEVPLRYGRAWTASDDEARARVAVISSALNERVFGGGDSTGRQLRLDQADFTVIGVIDRK